jgi:hypothetical protein
LHCRAAAIEAEEASRVAALESQQHVAGQIAAMQAQQALMAQQLATALSSNDALRAELAVVQVRVFSQVLLGGAREIVGSRDIERTTQQLATIMLASNDALRLTWQLCR